MNPKLWGPSLWTSLIYIVLNYPEAPTIDIKNDYRQFFLNLGRVLPCMECQKNYCSHLKVLPIDDYLNGQSLLLTWLWKVHNQINEFCDKPTVTLEQFLNKYLNRSDLSLTKSKHTGWLILFIIVLIWWFN